MSKSTIQTLLVVAAVIAVIGNVGPLNRAFLTARVG